MLTIHNYITRGLVFVTVFISSLSFSSISWADTCNIPGDSGFNKTPMESVVEGEKYLAYQHSNGVVFVPQDPDLFISASADIFTPIPISKNLVHLFINEQGCLFSVTPSKAQNLVNQSWGSEPKIINPINSAFNGKFDANNDGVNESSFTPATNSVFVQQLNADNRVATTGSANDLVLQLTGDLYKIRGTETSGISINRLSRFEVTNKPFKLLNSPIVNNNLKAPANIIVMELTAESNRNIILSNEISVVGQPSELIIVAPKNRTIVCDGCSFSNVTRVTLVTGYLEYLAGKKLDAIHVQDGKINVKVGGLHAPGITFLDVLSKNIELDGDINTNLKANKVGDSFQIDANGSQDITSGSAQLLAGEFAFSYDDSTFNVNKSQMLLFQANNITSSYQASAHSSIQAGSIHIETMGFNSETRIDQNLEAGAGTAATQLSYYRGQAVIPNNQITIKTNGHLSLGGEIDAANKIEVSSLDDIYIESTLGFNPTSITAPNIEIIAVKNIQNYASIDGENVSLVGANVINEGFLQGSTQLYLNGEQNIKNQFGGTVLAGNAKLETTGNVSLGSKFPFDIMPKSNIAKKMSVSTSRQLTDVVIFEDGSYGDFEEELDENKFLRIEKDTSEAQFLAQNIQINTASLNVINPYYVLHNGEGTLPALEQQWRDAVILGAGDRMIVNASSKVLNSSAIIETASGDLVFDTPELTNERYRLVISQDYGEDLDPEMCEKTQQCANYSSTTKNINYDIQDQYVHYFSPAGRINVGGNILFKNMTAMNNEFSYIEVANDLHAQVKNVTQHGIALQQEALETISTRHSVHRCRKKVLGKCFGGYHVHWWTNDDDLYHVTLGEVPALLFVEGYLFGEDGEKFSVHTLKFDSSGNPINDEGVEQ